MDRDPQKEHGTRDRDPQKVHGTRDRPSRKNMGPGSQTGSDIIQRPPPPMNRMTHASKNITLPQTSFAGGKNISFWFKWSEPLYDKIDLVSTSPCILGQ